MWLGLAVSRGITENGGVRRVLFGNDESQTHDAKFQKRPQGCRFNGVAPGWIAAASSTESEREAARYTPIGRAGTPDEVVAAACFLASREASYITGQPLVVDGGNILQENKAPR